MRLHSTVAGCTCFAPPPPASAGADWPPLIVQHPTIEGLFHAQHDNGDAELIFTPPLITSSFARVVFPRDPASQRCTVHGCPTLAAPCAADRLALASFGRSSRTSVDSDAGGEHREELATDCGDDRPYPLFAGLSKSGEVVVITEPRKFLQHVGYARPPYVYINGTGGLPVADGDAVETAILYYFSERKQSWQKSPQS